MLIRDLILLGIGIAAGWWAANRDREAKVYKSKSEEYETILRYRNEEKK